MERDLDEALDDLSKSRVPVFYIVDSFGAMYSEQVDVLVKKYAAALPGKTLGLPRAQQPATRVREHHRGDHPQLQPARRLALRHRPRRRQLPHRTLMAFLKNPKFDLRPVLAVIHPQLLPLQKSIEWGYHIPYLITGALNEHPRSAMKFMADPNTTTSTDLRPDDRRDAAGVRARVTLCGGFTSVSSARTL